MLYLSTGGVSIFSPSIRIGRATSFQGIFSQKEKSLGNEVECHGLTFKPNNSIIQSVTGWCQPAEDNIQILLMRIPF